MSLEAIMTDTHQAADALLSNGYLIDNTPRVQRLSLAIYRLLATGRAVSAPALSAALDWPEADIRTPLGSFPASVRDLDEQGRIVAFIGLSLAPSAHSFEVGAQQLYTWCALDALFLPEILGKPARLATRCPATGDLVEVALAPDRIVGASPDSTVMSIIDADAERCRDNLRGAFCNHVSLFAGPEAFAEWAADRVGVASVSLTQAFAMGQRRNAARFSDIELGPEEPPTNSGRKGSAS